MNHNDQIAGDSAFPALFVVASTFLGALAWLCVVLAGMQQN